MLCINMTSVRDNMPIFLNDKLNASRLYLSSADITSFPNRLVFTATRNQLAPLLTELGEMGEPWLNEEADILERGPIFLVIPIALRVQEEAYASFRSRSDRNVPENALELHLGEPRIFINNTGMNTICVACARQTTLKGRQCPDFQASHFSCFETSRFALDAMDTLYLTDKGDLVYNATSISAEPGEQVESSTTATSTDSES